MGKVGLSKTIESCAEEAAYHEVIGNGLARALNEFSGRLKQTYPGEFIKLKEFELSRYPPYRQTKW